VTETIDGREIETIRNYDERGLLLSETVAAGTPEAFT
jgi:hypothetical protein